MGLEAVFGVAASCALIVVVVATFENLRAWGARTGIKDTPAALAFAFVAIAQMHQPLEPFEGIIIDLRVVPLVLTGAFLTWHSAVLVVVSVCAVRIGIGGQGVWAGSMSICIAVASGVVWRQFLHRRASFVSYMLLGALGCTTLGAAVFLEAEIRAWFLQNAAPVLALTYMALLPLFASLMDYAPHVQGGAQRASRDTLDRNGVALLPLPAFLHQTRMGMLLDGSEDVAAVLTVRIIGLSRMFRLSSRARPADILDAVLLKLAGSSIDISVASKSRADTLLLPLTRAQVGDLNGVRETIKGVLHSLPLTLGQADQHWVSYELGLLRVDDLKDIKTLRPIKMDTRVAKAFGTWSAASVAKPVASDHFRQSLAMADIDLLFTKAELLSRRTRQKQC